MLGKNSSSPAGTNSWSSSCGLYPLITELYGHGELPYGAKHIVSRLINIDQHNTLNNLHLASTINKCTLWTITSNPSAMVMCPIHDTVNGQCTTVNTIFIAESWILWGKKTQQFYFGGEKMRNVRGQQGEPSKVKISGNKKSEQENKQQNLWWAYKTFFSIKCVTRKFHFVIVQNNIKEMCQNVCCTCKVFFGC